MSKLYDDLVQGLNEAVAFAKGNGNARVTKSILCRIQIVWDEDASVWVAASEDIPGFVLESGSLDALIERIKVAVPELLALNGQVYAAEIIIHASRRMAITSKQATSQMFEQFYGKPFEKITEDDIGPAAEIDWGKDVGGERIL